MKNNMVGKLALGATGVAVAAGAVAAGVALSNKKTRTKLMREAKKVGTMIEEGKERYQAIQHRIGIKRSTRLGKKLLGGKKRAAR